MPQEIILRQFTIVQYDYSRGSGRGRALVRCSCGAESWAYVWSWAGHGRRCCKGCGAKHLWSEQCAPRAQ